MIETIETVRAAALPVRAATAATRDLPRSFEAMILRPLLDVALPRGEAVFGAGTSGETWRSMLIDALAQDWAERGSLGITDRLLPEAAGAAAGDVS